jgi:hypothetical protein
LPETITTTVTTGITLNSTNNPLTITSTGGVSVSSSSIAIQGGADQIYNDGTVTGGFGIALSGNGFVSNGSTGVIEADGNSIGSTGIALLDGGTIINAGTILASLYGIAGLSGGIVSNTSGGLIEGGTTRLNAGIYIIGKAATITNDGTILGKYGVMLTTGTVDNQVNGTISSSGGTFGVKIFGGPGTVTNAGLIEGSYAIQIAGGTVNNLSGGTINGSGGVAGVYVSGAVGTVINAGVIENTGSKSGFGGIVLGDGGTITNLAGGTISGGDNEPGILIKGGGTVINAGTIGNPHYLAILFSGGGNDRLILDPTADLHGVVGGGSSSTVLELAAGTSVGYIQSLHTFYGFNHITLDNGAYWDIGGSITNTDTLTMDGKLGSSTLLVLVAPNEDSGTISGFQSGDAIGLYNEFFSGETFGNGFLTLTGAGPNETLAFAGHFSTKDFTLTSIVAGTEITTDIPCFCAGTRMLTTTGEKLVEDITPGDELITVLPGGPTSRKVVWTGQRQIKIANHATPALIRPIRIRAGAIAPGVPERDLRLSPHHAVYLDGCLFEAQALINNDTIYQEQNTETVTYHHIELDAHSIILANGMPAETFLDTGNRYMFDNNTVTTLHPDFRPKGDADFCAPLIREGDALTTARVKLTKGLRKITTA